MLLPLQALDSSQWTVLGVRLGDTKDAALTKLQEKGDVKIQEDSTSGRVFVLFPPSDGRMVMSLKVTLGRVTATNLVGAFAEWLQGDTQLLIPCLRR